MSVNVCRPSRRGRGTRRLSVEPNIRNVVYIRFWNSNPNPNVATARYTPERRKLGTDTTAPTANATPPADTSASSHGTPECCRWAKVVAPTAANAIWHNEICPDVHTSSPNDPKMIANTRPVVYWVICDDATTCGNTTAKPRPATVAGPVTLNGKLRTGRNRLTRPSPRATSLALGTTSNANTNTMNGTCVYSSATTRFEWPASL